MAVPPAEARRRGGMQAAPEGKAEGGQAQAAAAEKGGRGANNAHQLFALEGFDECGDAGQASHQGQAAQLACEEIARLLPGAGTREGELARLLAEAKRAANTSDAEVVQRHLAQHHGVETRLVTALGGGANCLRTLRWTFLEHDSLIVEPRFRESFAIAHPTRHFSKVLAVIPEEFVGTARRLNAIVEVVCEQIRLSFQAQGLPNPPWRQVNAMTSKWFPHPSRCRRSSCPAAPTASSVEEARARSRSDGSAAASPPERTTSPFSVLDDAAAAAAAAAAMCANQQPEKHAAHWSPAAPLEGCTVRGGVQLPQCNAALMCGYGQLSLGGGGGLSHQRT